MTEVITEILPNDILLGGDAPLAIGNEGNIRFRAIVKERQIDYVSTTCRKQKGIIATEVREEIKNRDGRFLRRVESGTERLALGIAVGVQAWVAADENAVMEDIEQSLRDLVESDGAGGAQTEGGSAEVARVDGDESSDSKQKPQKRPKVTNEMEKQKAAPEEVTCGASILPARNHETRETLSANLSDAPPEDWHRDIFTDPSFSPKWIDVGKLLPGGECIGPQLESSSLFHGNPHLELELVQRSLIEQLENDRAATLETLRGQELLLALLRLANEIEMDRLLGRTRKP